jgi:hypothetical protein
VLVCDKTGGELGWVSHVDCATGITPELVAVTQRAATSSVAAIWKV